MTYQPRYTVTARIAAALARIETARDSLSAEELPADRLATLRRRALAREAYHTTRIEGSQLSLDEVDRLLAGEWPAQAIGHDARELLNYADACAVMVAHFQSGKPISEALLRKLHHRLMSGVRGGVALPGRYRRVQIHLVHTATGANLYTPPPPGELRHLMADLVAWLADPGDTHPVIVAGLAQLELVRIHPFLDGNGRSGRLLSTLCLYRAGYDPARLMTISEYYDGNRPAYYHAVRLGNEEGADVTGWLAYFAAGLAVQLRNAAAQAASR